jgi:hypothetical protein
MNTFQKWAEEYAAGFGFTVTTKGNWVVVAGGNQTVECMSEQGVKDACRQIDDKRQIAEQWGA